MRGGLRCGSGRPGWHIKAENLLSIDVRQWASHGKLFPGNCFGWHWNQDGERIVSIGVRVISVDELSLEYGRSSDKGNSRQNIHAPIFLDHTSCHYGGTRVWFLCPDCGRRVAILYLVRGRWCCRKSLNVAYASQSEDMTARMYRRIAKLESKLAEDEEKPKGMHWTTYNLIIDKINDAQSRMDSVLYVRFGQ